MLLNAISIVYLSSSLGLSETVNTYERDEDDLNTDYRTAWTREKSGYWFTGVYSTWWNDRYFKWRYGRPFPDANTDYTYPQPTVTSDQTPEEAWIEECDDNYAISKISSEFVDDCNCNRLFEITCKKLPTQYTLSGCQWQSDYSGGMNSGRSIAESTIDYTCSNGVMRGIDSYYGYFDRWYKFYCCEITYTPMDISTTYDAKRVLTQITSSYTLATGTRDTSSSKWGKPNVWWDIRIQGETPCTGYTSSEGTYQERCEAGNGLDDGYEYLFNVDRGSVKAVCGIEADCNCCRRDPDVDYTYDLTPTRANVYSWARVCPLNGAFATFTQNTDGSFNIDCAVFITAVKTDNCAWTDYLNEFHIGFTGSCDGYGAIRGIQSYYSPVSDDRKFKIYCCDIIRETYTQNTDIRMKLKATTHSEATSEARIMLDLCWNNYLYQGILSLSEADVWLSTEDVVRYDPCGNVRALIVSMVDTDDANIEAIAVEDSSVDYIIETFNVHTSVSAEPTPFNSFWLGSNEEQMQDVVIKFPDDYLTQCASSNGCAGDLYNLDDFQEYLISIKQCASYSSETIAITSTPQIGVVLRGLNGNLDKVILNIPISEETPAGEGNIGDLMHIHLEYESGADVCIESITLHDPYDGSTEFGQEFFGDGIILSESCTDDGDFRLLTGIQYVPCYDTPFSITTYETSLYTSVQIHSCSGIESGIAAVNSALFTLTITGISKSDKFISSDMLLLKTSTDWSPGTSRDYTLQLSGDFDKISLVTLTNNHQTDAICVDSVLINGEDAFLSNYWVGPTTDHDSLPTIPAVLEWPICDIELTTTIKAEAPLPVDPEAVATSTCVNRNRLVTVDCEISQSFETYQEVSWQQEIGEEVTEDTTWESGTSTSVSASMTLGAGYETMATNGVSEVTQSYSAEFTAGFDHDWSSSKSVSEGVTTIDTTTDGKVDGKTISVDCSGSVSVPPSQQIEYALLFENSAAKLTTLTDIKMTKCSAYLYGQDEGHDPNDYIYIYGIEGELTVKEATNCYVSFSQAEQVSPEGITCGEERALATREWGTYVPQCDEIDPAKYMKCQCAFGDSLTLPTCGCVDETSGNLMDEEISSVVAETDTFKWTHWCEQHCGSDSVNIVAADSVPFQFEPDTVNDDKDTVNSDKKGNFFDNNGNILLGIMYILLGIIGMVGITYVINSCISCYKNCRYGSEAKYSRRYADMHDMDDMDVEKEVV